MKKVLVVGSINVDLTFECNKLPVMGETLISNRHRRYFGGKGANQAIGLSRLGVNVKMIGCVGNDHYGQKLINNLKENNVDVSGIKTSKENLSGLAIIAVDKHGNNQIIVSPGANFDLTIDDLDLIEQYIVNSDIILCQLETPLVVVEQVLKIAKQYDKVTVLNPAPAQTLTHEILHNCDYLIPNETELSFLSDCSNIKNPDKAIQTLLNKGVKNVIATLGDKGAVYANKEKTIYYKALKVKAVDTTGAGDSFIAGFVYGLACEYDPNDAIKFANKVAAITVTRKGVQESLPFINELDSFIFED